MRRALVLGIGRFGGGLEATHHLLRHGWQVRIADKAGPESLAQAVAALRGASAVEWRLGSEQVEVLEDVELVVVNPAVPMAHPLLAEAARRGIACSQEVNLFLEHYPGRIVLVTGTKGKSTTASLLHSALAGAGIDALLGGNIGHSLLADEARWRAKQVAVLEVSSFQLERIDPAQHQVEGAVLVPVTKDHLDRHGSLAAYHRAKAVAALAAREFLVHAHEDPVASAFQSAARRRVTYTLAPPADGQVGQDGGWIHARLPHDAGPVLHQAALHLLGEFQRSNVMAAFAAAALLGADRHRAALAIAQARALPYRLQLCLRQGGVRLYDNAVSTELQSTLAAACTVPPPVHWVGGGKSKDDDFAAVADALAPHLASAHLFGAAAAPMGALLRTRLPLTLHERLGDALAAAWAAADGNGSVLFSPGFASFDQYPNFRARAEEFHSWTRALAGKATTPVSWPGAPVERAAGADHGSKALLPEG